MRLLLFFSISIVVLIALSLVNADGTSIKEQKPEHHELLSRVKRQSLSLCWICNGLNRNYCCGDHRPKKGKCCGYRDAGTGTSAAPTTTTPAPLPSCDLSNCCKRQCPGLDFTCTRARLACEPYDTSSRYAEEATPCLEADKPGCGPGACKPSAQCGSDTCDKSKKKICPRA